MLKTILKVLESWEIDLQEFSAKLILGLFVLLIFYILGKVFKKLAFKINRKVLSKYYDVQLIFSACIYYFFLITGYYFFLKIIGLEQYFVKLLAGAGIIGIIAGFALKDIASNAFSGMLLFLEKPYRKNDWVQVDGHFGKVLKVGLLTTSIVNKTGQQVYISNQLIYSGAFINYSAFNKRGVRLQTDVEQFFDLKLIKNLLGNQIKNIKTFVPDQEVHFFVNSISNNGNFSLEIFFWVYFDNEQNFLNTISDTIVNIKQVSIDNNINIINTEWISDEDNTTSSGAYGAGGD